MNSVQKLIKRASEVVGIAAIAEAWRENLNVVIASTVLLLLGAVVPLVLPKAAACQSYFVIPALPLTGVCFSLQQSFDSMNLLAGLICIMVIRGSYVFLNNESRNGVVLFKATGMV